MKYIKHFLLALLIITLIPVLCSVAARSIGEKTVTAGEAVSLAVRDLTNGKIDISSRLPVCSISRAKEERLIYLVDLISCTDCRLCHMMLISLDREGDSPRALHLSARSLICPEGEDCLLCDYFAKCTREKKDQGCSDSEAAKYAAEKTASFLEQSLDIDIRGSLTLDSRGLSEITDALGNIELTEEQEARLTCSDGSELVLKKGVNMLSGRDIDPLLRGDSREKYGRELLLALNKRVKRGLCLPDIIRLTGVLSRAIVTDMGVPELVTALAAMSAGASQELISLDIGYAYDEKTGGISLDADQMTRVLTEELL